MRAPQQSATSRSVRHKSATNAALLGLLVAGMMSMGEVPMALAADWPQYRGLNRDARSSETGLLESWPESGPRELWRVPLGSGYSGMAVADGRVLTMFGTRGSEVAAAFDADSGEELWRFEMGREMRNREGNGPRATPTVDGRLVFVLGARAQLFALDTATGEARWSLDLQKELGARVPEWGTSTSPLVEGETLIVDVAGRRNYGVVAFDKHTGEIVWHNGSHRPAYSSPIAVTLGGERQIVLFTAEGVRGVSAADGQDLWLAPWTTDWDVNAATPVFVPRNGIFVSSGYDTGAALFQIVKEGEEFEVSQVWRNRVMKNHFNSSVLVGGYIYGFDMGNLKCVDALTGEEKWRARRGFSKGSLLYADGLLFVMGGSGNLGLVEATPEGFRSRSRVKVLEGRTWTMPSLSDGVLYLRDFEQMIALRVGKDTG